MKEYLITIEYCEEYNDPRDWRLQRIFEELSADQVAKMFGEDFTKFLINRGGVTSIAINTI